MAFSEAEWKLIEGIHKKYPEFSIRMLKDKIKEELGINVGTTALYNKLFQKKSEQKENKKSEQKEELVVSKGKDGRNKYNKFEMKRQIEKLHLKGMSSIDISQTLQIPEDTVEHYLYRMKNSNGKTRSQQLKEDKNRILQEKVKKLICKIVDDIIEDYENNREFEKGLLKTKKAELSILMKKLQSLCGMESAVTEKQLKEHKQIVALINMLTSNYTKETILMLRDLGYTNEQKAIHTNVEHAEKMIVIDEYLKGVLEDDNE